MIRRQEVGLPGGKFSSQGIGRHDTGAADEIVPNLGRAYVTRNSAIMPQLFGCHLLRNLGEFVTFVVTGNQVSAHVVQAAPPI